MIFLINKKLDLWKTDKIVAKRESKLQSGDNNPGLPVDRNDQFYKHVINVRIVFYDINKQTL